MKYFLTKYFPGKSESLRELAAVRAAEKIQMAQQQLWRYETVVSQISQSEQSLESPRPMRVDQPDRDWRALLYDLGMLHTKLIKKLFWCLTDSQQIGKIEIETFPHFSIFTLLSGVFLLISFCLELMALTTNFGLYAILYRTGFFWSHGLVLFLLKYLSLLVLLSHIWQAKRENLPFQIPAQAQTGPLSVRDEIRGVADTITSYLMP